MGRGLSELQKKILRFTLKRHQEIGVPPSEFCVFAMPDSDKIDHRPRQSGEYKEVFGVYRNAPWANNILACHAIFEQLMRLGDSTLFQGVPELRTKIETGEFGERSIFDLIEQVPGMVIVKYTNSYPMLVAGIYQDIDTARQAVRVIEETGNDSWVEGALMAMHPGPVGLYTKDYLWSVFGFEKFRRDWIASGGLMFDKSKANRRHYDSSKVILSKSLAGLLRRGLLVRVNWHGYRLTAEGLRVASELPSTFDVIHEVAHMQPEEVTP